MNWKEKISKKRKEYMATLSPEIRTERAKNAARSRWKNKTADEKAEIMAKVRACRV